MSLQIINLGATANDRGGDPLRTAFTKVNDNFTELYANLSSYLPNPTGNAGKFLTTNGSALTWAPTLTYTQSTTPPSSPNAYSLWYDEVTGRIYTWYNSNWVDASPPLADYKSTPPNHPQGAIGDVEGQWSADFNYYYYCSSNFVGNNAPIWRRVAFDSSNNWSIYAGGGGGSTLPADSIGYLYNNGSGTITWINNTQGYALPNATTSVLGGVKVDGTTIVATNGVISSAPQINSDWSAISGVSAILNKPTIPAAQIQSDWTVTDNTLKSFIKNKPTIPSLGGFTLTNNQLSVSNNGNITLLTNTHSWVFNSNGSLTFPDASIQYTAYTGTAFPSQSGNSGKYLTTNGSGTLSWGNPLGTNTVNRYTSNINNNSVGATQIDPTSTKVFLKPLSSGGASYSLSDGLYDGQQIQFLPDYRSGTTLTDIQNVNVYITKIFSPAGTAGQYGGGNQFPWYPFSYIQSAARPVGTLTWDAMGNRWIPDPYSFD
jgi:hypothetical protein